MRMDVLEKIMDEHLTRFQDPSSDRKSFLKEVLTDYLAFLRKDRFAVPLHMEGELMEEYLQFANALLLKRLYGSSQELKSCLKPVQDSLDSLCKPKAKPLSLKDRSKRNA